MTSVRAIVLVLGVAGSVVAGADDPSVRVGQNVHISASRAADVHYELLGGADPTNANRLLSCIILSDEKVGKDTTIVYASDDGGASWKPTLDTRAFRMTGDPVCMFGPDGTAYYSALTIGSPLTTPSKTLVYRSKDGGKTWSEPVQLPIIDRQYLVADGTRGKYHGRLYLHGTGVTRPMDAGERKTGIHLFTSTDNGATWSSAVIAASIGNNWILGTAPGVVLSDGTLVLLVGEVQDYLREGRSRIDWPEDNRPNSKLKILTSTDGGESFKPATTIGDWYFAWPPSSICCVPWLAADATTGTFKDRLYAVWTDLRSGRSEILFAYSADKGKTWSKPVPVNDDQPAAAPGGDHFKPVVEVNKDGVVGVMWHDRRDAKDNLGWTVRFAASFDGGETFAPSVAVASKPNVFRDTERWPLRGNASGGGSPTQPAPGITLSLSLNGMMFSGGHTAAMPVDAKGVFHPMWIDNRTGVPQVWTAPVTPSGQVVRHGDRTLADLEDITSKVSMEMSGLSYDRAKNTATFSLSMKNTSKEKIRAPLKVRVRSVSSPLGNAEFVVGDKAVRGPGLVWDFSSAAKNGVLEPDATTDAKTVTVRFRDLKPIRDGRRFRFSLLQVDALVLGKPEKAKETTPAGPSTR